MSLLEMAVKYAYIFFRTEGVLQKAYKRGETEGKVRPDLAWINLGEAPGGEQKNRSCLSHVNIRLTDDQQVLFPIEHVRLTHE